MSAGQPQSFDMSPRGYRSRNPVLGACRHGVPPGYLGPHCGGHSVVEHVVKSARFEKAATGPLRVDASWD